METPSLHASTPSPGGKEFNIAHYEGDVERSLVLRASSGDRAALAPLWDKHWRSLYRYFKRSVSSADEAEDLASETLLVAFDSLASFRGEPGASVADAADDMLNPLVERGCSFGTYLHAIARRKLANYIRRTRQRQLCPLVDDHPASPSDGSARSIASSLPSNADPVHEILRQERMDEACYALADVGMRSSEQFKALLLHYFCGLPHKDVAMLLGTRSETINSRLQHGRKAMLRHYDRTPPAKLRAV